MVDATVMGYPAAWIWFTMVYRDEGPGARIRCQGQVIDLWEGKQMTQ